MVPSFQSEAWLLWERERIELARAGRRDAFDDLYRAFAPALYAQVLVPRLRDRSLAEDALAETFRALLEHLDDFSAGRTSLWFWLMRVAINKANDAHRRSGRARSAFAKYDVLVGASTAPAPTPMDELELRAEHDVRKARVQAVLEAISPRYRLAIELRLLQEQSRERCAQALGVKVATFDVVFLRAVRAFRAEWDAREEIDGERR